MDGRMIGLIFVAMIASVCRAAPVPGSLTVLVGPPVSVQRGSRALLPCWLSPAQNAEDLEVRWYRSNFDTPVMLYKGKKFEEESQEPSYAGRVSFGLKDTTSGGLKAGDVSLRLENVTIEDAGEYNCYASSLNGYDSAAAMLHVTETGGPPLMSTVWKEEKVNVSCESEGWYPRPELRWSDKTKDLSPDSVVYSSVSSGHFSVHSWLLVSGSSEVSCSVGLSNMVAKEARIRMIKPPEKEPESSSGGWVAFGIVLIIALALLAALLYFKKKEILKPMSRTDESDGKKSSEAEENAPLLLKEVVQPTALSTASKHYENIKLEETNNEFLKVKDTMLRDAKRETFPDGERVTCLTAIRGTPGVSSEKHYWEVSLGNPNIEPKKSWWIGVTTATEIPQDSHFCPNTSNGFWFLSSSPDTGNALQFSTKPEVFLPVQSRPEKVGVYLDYDSGEISFYNVEEKSLILSLMAKFTEEVFPFFNPGKRDKAPMRIIQKPEKPSENETAVGSVENNSTGPTASEPVANQTPSEPTTSDPVANQTPSEPTTSDPVAKQTPSGPAASDPAANSESTTAAD